MLNRYLYYQNFINKFQINKFILFSEKQIILLYNLKIIGGLYKINNVLIQPYLLLMALVGQRALAKLQFHGKRKRCTVAYFINLLKYNVWDFLDKMLHEFILHFLDFRTPKFKKGLLKKTNTYTWRLRHRISLYEEFDDLTEFDFYTLYRGVYLPLMLHFNLNRINQHFFNECYFHMLKVPFWMYKKKQRPAHDDMIQT